jgi:hypothetical protein
MLQLKRLIHTLELAFSCLCLSVCCIPQALCQIVGEALVESQRKQDLFRLQRSLQALVLIAYQDKAGVEACEKV